MVLAREPDDDRLVRLHPTVDHVSWKCFEAEFERQFRKLRGTDFQTLFRRIMKKAHGDEFLETRPHGSLGDMSCDGYLRTTRTIFASYAPRSLRTRPAASVDKLRKDFDGAVEHWSEHMSAWCLVHNDDEGLPPHIVRLLVGLASEAPNVKVETLCIDDLRHLLQAMRRDDLVDLFGPQVSLRDLVGLSQADVKQVVDDLGALIEHGQEVVDVDVRQVPPTKMTFNRLSKATRALLRLGEQKASLVQQYFEGHPDPLFAARVVDRFKSKYRDLQATHADPNEIFWELQIFAGYRRRPEHAVGALALLAYLFESCHIFERPFEDAGGQ